MHGIASNKNELKELATALVDRGVEVHNMEIGNGMFDSIFMNINKQCETLANNIDKLGITNEKINIIGISQGGLLARCYTERFSHKIKPVSNLITIATPHMGLYSEDFSMDNLPYWKNPFMYAEYIMKNDFLVYINNAKKHDDQSQYKQNMINLDNFTMIWSGIDTIIKPIASAKFEYYDIELAQKQRKLTIDALIDSVIFIEDMIGLRELFDGGRLHRYQYDCHHNEFKLPKCFREIHSGDDHRTILDILAA
jgi:palmitoyl-protein thioesterase